MHFQIQGLKILLPDSEKDTGSSFPDDKQIHFIGFIPHHIQNRAIIKNFAM
jgi:hypothetical protein